jgi:diguanylate cyclase (GGDEF)-like protein
MFANTRPLDGLHTVHIGLGPLAQMLALWADTPVLVAAYDHTDTLRYANAAFVQAYRAQEGQTWAELMRANHCTREGAQIDTDDIDAWIATARSRRGKTPYRAFEAELHGGRWLWMTETVHANGWLLSIASDVTPLHTGHRALRQDRDRALRAALTDPLTGISNRHHLMTVLRASLAAPHHQPLAIAVLDLDHFKRINDTLGHAAGDVILRDFATHMQHSARREDTCGRQGGEEFLMLFPRTTVADARHQIARLMHAVRTSRPLAGQPALGYTCSIGLAQARADDTAEALIHRADVALYAAKAGGRDRVVEAAGD